MQVEGETVRIQAQQERKFFPEGKLTASRRSSSYSPSRSRSIGCITLLACFANAILGNKRCMLCIVALLILGGMVLLLPPAVHRFSACHSFILILDIQHFASGIAISLLQREIYRSSSSASVCQSFIKYILPYSLNYFASCILWGEHSKRHLGVAGEDFRSAF